VVNSKSLVSPFVTTPLGQLKLTEGHSLALAGRAVAEVCFPAESSMATCKIRILASDTKNIWETEGNAVFGLDGVWQA